MTTTLIVPAAGHGRRFGDAIPKQFCALAGATVLTWALRPFAGLVDEVVIACAAPWETQALAGAAAAGLPRARCVRGDNHRQASVAAALRGVASDCTHVLVHDAARPLIRAAEIRACCDALATHIACVLACPCQQTVKQAANDGTVHTTLDRSRLWLAQTPQGFRLAEGLLAFAQAERAGWPCTDDAQVLEQAGYAVHIVPGRNDNLKITTPDDLALATALLAAD